MTEKSVFATLSTISVKDKLERKGNLDYLSWANAWSMLKAIYPDAQRKVYEHDHTGFNYFTDGRTAYVKVGIIVGGIEHIDYLPVMDFRNNAIPIEKITATDVNKTIQRSTAKAIAMHGLGLSLWTGEDIVDAAEPKSAPTEAEQTPTLVKDSEEWNKVVTYIEANKEKKFINLLEQINKRYTLPTNISKELEKIHKK